MIKNKILLLKRNLFYIQKPCSTKEEIQELDNNNLSNRDYVNQFKTLLEGYGYTLSNNAIDFLTNNYSINEIINWIIPTLSDLNDIFNLDDVLNSISLHTFNLSFINNINELNQISNNVDYKIFDLGTDIDVYDVLKNILLSTSAWSIADKEIMEDIINSEDDFYLNYIEEITNKENLTYFSSLLLNNKILDFNKVIFSLYKTSTDILRLAAALSSSDVSLSDKIVFKSMPNKTRRLLLGLLDNLSYKNAYEDMLRYKGLWIALSEKLHPGDYANRYKNAYKLISDLKNNKKITTFNSKVEKAIENKDIDNILKLLSSRPSEFGRRLDKVLRTFYDNEKEQLKILSEFNKIACEIPLNILLTLSSHFSNRNNDSIKYKAFYPKGNISKSYVIENKLEGMSIKVLDFLLTTISLACYYNVSLNKELDLGKCYIHNDLINYKIPTTLRNSSGKQLETLARGSRISLDNKDVIRGFIYWKGNHVDLDLSAILLDKNLNRIKEIAFYNLNIKSCYHSGDILTAPNGATEFIDINLKGLKETKNTKDVAYIAFNVHSFSLDKFNTLSDCFMGLMGRNELNSKELYDPKSVLHKSDLTTPTIANIPYVIDIEANEAIWVDLDISRDKFSYIGITAKDTIKYSKYALLSILNSTKPSLYELFMIHVLTRGEKVSTIEEADTAFLPYKVNNLKENVKVITPYQTDIILSEYL